MANPADPKQRFAVCRQRVARSYEHLRALDREIGDAVSAFAKGEAYRIAYEVNAELGDHVFVLTDVRPLPLVRWGIMAGDVVHQARASLDNLIEALNIAHVGKPGRRTEFPVYRHLRDFICGDQPGFKKMGDIDREAMALIESLQPYHRGDDYEIHALWVLHSLWIMDKHRNTAVVADIVQQQSTQILYTENGVPTDAPMIHVNASIGFPFKEGTELVHVRLQPRPNAKVEVKPTMTLEVTFGDGPASGMAVVPNLAECVADVAATLTLFEKFF